MKKWFVLFVVVFSGLWGGERVVASEVERFDVPVDHEWVLTFNEPFAYGGVTVRDADGEPHAVTVKQIGKRRVRVQPIEPYAEQTVYALSVSPSTYSSNGQSVEPYRFVFQTESLPVPEPEPEPVPLPDGTVYLSDYSFVWVHDPDVPASHFHLDGIDPSSGALVGGVTMSALHDYGLPGRVGYTREYVRQLHRHDPLVDQMFNGKYVMRLYDRHYIDTFLYDGAYVHYIYDVHNENRVRTIFWVTVDVENEREFFLTKGDALYEASMGELVWLFANVDREKAGVHRLGRDERLDAVAYAHSVDMIERDYFAHVNLDGKDQNDRVREAGISYYGSASENITKGQQNAIFAHEAFMHSIGHQLTLLEVGYDTMGVGVKLTKGGNPHVTQLYVRLK